MPLTDYEIERQRRLEANEKRLKELGLKQVLTSGFLAGIA